MTNIKNISNLFIALFLLIITSCSLDDDNVNAIEDCFTCENLTTQYCYLEGNNFYTSTINNLVTEIELNNQTWQEIKVVLNTNCTASLGDYANGYFIINEGSFGSGIGTLSFVDHNGTITHNVYQNVNNEPMGNLLQSIYLHNDKAYLVLNGSHKIVVTNRYTMQKLATIHGNQINNPRYFVAIDNKAYVSNWNDAFNPNDDHIAIINLLTNQVESTIPIGEGPEDMLVNNNKVYVNMQGGFGQNNKVAIINTTTDSIISTIEVGHVPNSIQVDKNNDIWILCGGKPSFTDNETNGSLVKITNDQIDQSTHLNLTDHPEHLSINTANDTLYYSLNGKIYSQSITATVANQITGFDGFYYGMSIVNNKLYTLNAGDFVSEGTLKIFDLTSNNTEIITTGIIPNSVYFQ